MVVFGGGTKTEAIGEEMVIRRRGGNRRRLRRCRAEVEVIDQMEETIQIRSGMWTPPPFFFLLLNSLPFNKGSQRIYIYISHITYKIPKFG